jgi:AraC-like DNA-binding protein
MGLAAAPERGHTVPISLVSQLVQLVKRWHVPADEILSSVELSAKTLEDPSERLPVATMCSLLERARDLTGEPGLGYFLGLQTRATLYGYLGFAALSASSVRDALGLAVQFAPTFSTALTIDLRVEGDLAWLRLEEHADLGSVRDVVLISMVLGLREIGRALTGEQVKGSADLAIPEPEYQARFADIAPNIRFGQPVNRILFDSAIIDLPIVMADPFALRLAQKHCERDLDELVLDARLASRVRHFTWSNEGGFRSFKEVAACLNMSPRSLRRHLAAQGESFAALVEGERRDMALQLLRCSRLSIEDVAKRLEYRRVSSFVRAFHKWTGETPGAYRRTIWGRSQSSASG